MPTVKAKPISDDRRAGRKLADEAFQMDVDLAAELTPAGEREFWLRMLQHINRVKPSEVRCGKAMSRL